MPVSGCWRALSAGLLLLACAGSAAAQSGEQKKERNPLAVTENIVDSPRVTSNELISGAGQTGYISQKKKTPAKKKQAQKKDAREVPAAPAADANLVARNPSLLRAPNAASASQDVTGSISPLRRRRPPLDDDPFGPVGFYSGAHLVRPSIELQTGFDSNAQKIPNGQSSWFNTLQGVLQTQSQWQRHELSLDLRGSYTKFYDIEGLDRPEVQATLRGRIDVTSVSKIELETKFGLATQYPASPDAIASVRQQPNVYSFGQTAAWVQRFNRFEVTAGVGIERNIYDAAELTDGSTLSLRDRDYNEYSARLRGAYEWSPDVKPFVEVGVDRRERDLPVDFNGILRDSDGYVLRAGITFGRKEYLFGEISAGFAHRSYADPSLADVSGLIFDGQLTWLATGLTTFKLNAASTIDETAVPGASGVLRREAKLTMDHAFRRWLVGSLSVGWLSEEYEGTALVNDYLRTSAALTYSLSRSLALRGEYRNERLFSSDPGRDYTANIGLIGIRLQR
jgi:hypothetical protein